MASWPVIRFFLVLSSIYNWHTTQLDLVLDYPQAPAEWLMYMRIPKGITLDGDELKYYVLKIHRNFYRNKQADRVWNQNLVPKLKAIRFIQYRIDRCVFFKGRIIYVLYTDDSILLGPCKKGNK